MGSLTFENIMDCHPGNQDVFDEMIKCRGRIIPFIGAGLSLPIYPLWGQALLEAARPYGPGYIKEVKDLLDKNKYEETATYLLKVMGEGSFYRHFDKIFHTDKIDPAKISKAAKLLPEIFFNSLITTNYDRLLEKLYLACGSSFDRILYELSDSSDKVIGAIIGSKAHHYLIKLHGNWDDDTRVLTKESYDKIYGASPDDETPFVEGLKKIFGGITILFLGCGLERDRTISVLEKIKSGYKDCFAIMPLPECTIDPADKNRSILNDPATGKRRPDFKAKELNLSNLHIKTIWYPAGQHEAVAIILEKMKSKSGGPSLSAKIKHTHGFLGRENEVKAILDGLKRGESLWLVSGPAGVGKTELCREIAGRTAPLGGWETIEVYLQGKAGLPGLLDGLGEELKLAENPKPEQILSALADRSRNRRILLYLDNFEDVLGADKEAVGNFLLKLRRLDNLSVLMSSRISLRGVPETELHPLPLEDAVELFYSIWNDSSKELGSRKGEVENFVNEKLSCLPLAVVLAAAQRKFAGGFKEMMELWAKYSDFEQAIPDNPSHKSLSTALRTSFEFIKNDKISCQIWGLMSLFPASVSQEILTELIGGQANDLRSALEKMAGLSLIERRDNECFMLAPLKGKIFKFCDTAAFGGEEHSLEILGEYYSEKLGKACEEQNASNPAHLFILDRLDDVIFFLHVLVPGRAKSLLAKIHSKMMHYYQFRAAASAQLLEDIIKQTKTLELSAKLHADTILRRGVLQRRLGEVDKALGHYEQAKELYIAERDNLGRANTLKSMGDLQSRLGKSDKALGHYEQAKELYIAERDNLGRANTLTSMGDLQSRLGELDEALGLYEEAKEIHIAERNNLGLANTLRSMGDLQRRLGEIDEALGLYKEAKELFIAERNNLGLANTLRSMGDLQCRLGEPDKALGFFEEAEKLYISEQDNLGLANTFFLKAILLHETGNNGEALKLLAQAKELYLKERIIEYVNIMDNFVAKINEDARGD